MARGEYDDRRSGAGGSGRRHTGVVRRGQLPRSRRPPSTLDWLAILLVAGIGLAVVVAVSGLFAVPGALPDESASPTAFAAGTASPLPSPIPPTARPATPTPSPSPSPTPRPSPTPSPSPSPTPRPSPTPSPSPSPTLTPPTGELLIIEPADGARLSEQAVIVRGLAPPGATVTQDIPFWFDEHTEADASGRWSMAVRLAAGENVLTFRLGSDRATARSITLYHEPE